MKMTPNELTWLNEQNNLGIVSGSGIEEYLLNDGRSYAMNTKWSATLIHEDGAWKLRTFNSSVDFLDNPILDEVEAAVMNYAVISGVAGLLIGLILGIIIMKLGRRKKN